MLKKLLKYLGFGLLALIAIIAFNTLRYTSPEIADTKAELSTFDQDKIAQSLRKSIQYKTISASLLNPKTRTEFHGFVNFLVSEFPNANRVMERELVNDLTPLYKWVGSDATARPILITGHYDVVTVTANADETWDYPPFSGEIADGYVWGRGTLDDKGAIIAMMHAVENLAKQGFTPKRTIYFSFGHDEEVGGRRGAGAVVKHLSDAGVQLEWTLDEGSMVLRDVVPGLNTDMASINVAEKGYLTLDITTKSAGGHASLPPRDTAVSDLAHALANLQENPVKGGLTGVSKDFFNAIGPNFALGQRIVFANQWLFKPLLENILSKSSSTDAMLRTSMAPTMLKGSQTENVLAQEATATINFRLHPRDTIEDVIQHVHDNVGDIPVDVEIREGAAREASTISSKDSAGFSLLAQTFSQVFGEVIIVPGLTIAATDTVHYLKISDDSYRINPFIFRGEDIPRIHGKNERISIDNMLLGTQFYTQLMMNLDR